MSAFCINPTPQQHAHAKHEQSLSQNHKSGRLVWFIILFCRRKLSNSGLSRRSKSRGPSVVEMFEHKIQKMSTIPGHHFHHLFTMFFALCVYFPITSSITFHWQEEVLLSICFLCEMWLWNIVSALSEGSPRGVIHDWKGRRNQEESRGTRRLNWN